MYTMDGSNEKLPYTFHAIHFSLQALAPVALIQMVGFFFFKYKIHCV